MDALWGTVANPFRLSDVERMAYEMLAFRAWRDYAAYESQQRDFQEAARRATSAV